MVLSCSFIGLTGFQWEYSPVCPTSLDCLIFFQKHCTAILPLYWSIKQLPVPSCSNLAQSVFHSEGKQNTEFFISEYLWLEFQQIWLTLDSILSDTFGFFSYFDSSCIVQEYQYGVSELWVLCWWWSCTWDQKLNALKKVNYSPNLFSWMIQYTQNWHGYNAS